MNGKIMKGIVASLAGMLVMACSGCGGGGGGSPSAPATQSAPVAKKVVTIDAEGDSTYFGLQIVNGVRSTTANNPPALLQKSFGDRATVINNGQAGATVQDALNGLAPRYTATLAARLTANHAQIVVSNFGINDATRGEDYRSNLITWINTVRGMGALPVLEEPNPVCTDTAPKLDNYVTILRDVAAQNNVPLIAQYDYIKSLPNWQGMLPDCTHPTDELYAIKAQREFDVLSPIVAGMQ